MIESERAVFRRAWQKSSIERNACAILELACENSLDEPAKRNIYLFARAICCELDEARPEGLCKI